MVSMTLSMMVVIVVIVALMIVVGVTVELMIVVGATTLDRVPLHLEQTTPPHRTGFG